MMRLVLVPLLLMVVHTAALCAASLNFQASREYTVKNEPVTFTVTYDPQGSDVPKALVIEFNPDGDQTIDHTLALDAMDGSGIRETYTMAYDRAGYFDATATFRFTWIDENGLEQKNTNELGPIRINVANWKFTADDSLGCIESTPAVSSSGDTVYVGSENGSLYAVNTDNGNQRWQFVTGGSLNSSPCVDGSGNVFFGSEDGNIYSLDAGGLIRWYYPTPDPVFSSPALDPNLGRIYIGANDGWLYTLDSGTGELIWRFLTNGKIVSSPVIAHDGTIYIGSLGKTLFAVNPDGSERWRFDARSEILNGPALDRDGTLFFGTASFRGAVDDNNGLYALSGTGIQKWFIEHASGFAGSPVIDATGTVCIGSNNNTLYGINRAGGNLVMYKQFSSDVLTSPAIGSNGYIFAGSKDGMFYGLNLFKGDERSGRNEIWKYNLSLPVTTSSPIINDGYLYVGACGYSKGALFSFVCDLDNENPDTNPEEDAPWPQFRNLSDNSGGTGFSKDTVFPEIVSMDPEQDTRVLDIEKRSISVTFSMAMEPSSIFVAPDPDQDESGYIGFTVEPFDAPVNDFTITWNTNDPDHPDYTILTLTLPDSESFEPDITYTATILSKAHAAGEPSRSILYPLSWNFSNVQEETIDYSHSAGGCFISTLLD